MVAVDYFTEIQSRNELEGAPRARILSTLVSFMQFSIRKNKQKKDLLDFGYTAKHLECRTQAWNAKNAAPVGKMSTQRTVWALKTGLHTWLYCLPQRGRLSASIVERYWTLKSYRFGF